LDFIGFPIFSYSAVVFLLLAIVCGTAAIVGHRSFRLAPSGLQSRLKIQLLLRGSAAFIADKSHSICMYVAGA